MEGQDLELQEVGEIETVDSVVEDCTRCHDPHRGRDHWMLRADYETSSLRRASSSDASTKLDERPDGQGQIDVLGELP